MRLKIEPPVYLHILSESQLKAAALAISDLPPWCYCLAEHPEYTFHAKLWKLLSCICTRESLICSIPACRESSAAQQMAGEPGVPRMCPLLPQESFEVQPSIINFLLYLDNLCFLQTTTEHSSTLWREGNALKEKEKKPTVQSCREFRPGSFLGV